MMIILTGSERDAYLNYVYNKNLKKQNRIYSKRKNEHLKYYTPSGHGLTDRDITLINTYCASLDKPKNQKIANFSQCTIL